MAWSIILYETRQGRSPVADFISSLPVALRAKLARDIDLLSEFGPSIGEPHVKKLVNTAVDLWELRTRRGRDQVRTLFHLLEAQRIVLLHCFIKKTQRVPRREIETAVHRLRLFVESE